MQGVSSQDRGSKTGIGFEIYDLKGEKVTSRRLPRPKYENDGGYKVGTTVSFDGAINHTGGTPLTVLITTFEPEYEAKFRFTVNYKQRDGTVKLEKF